MGYKVLYYPGGDVGLTTRVAIGRLSLADDQLVILGRPGLSIPIEAIRSVELFLMHGTGRMLKIDHTDGTLFVSVIRFCLFGYLAVGNSFATGRLRRELEALIRTGREKYSAGDRTSDMA